MASEEKIFTGVLVTLMIIGLLLSLFFFIKRNINLNLGQIKQANYFEMLMKIAAVVGIYFGSIYLFTPVNNDQDQDEKQNFIKNSL
jgi:hypothetical protein